MAVKHFCDLCNRETAQGNKWFYGKEKADPLLGSGVGTNAVKPGWRRVRIECKPVQLTYRYHILAGHWQLIEDRLELCHKCIQKIIAGDAA